MVLGRSQIWLALLAAIGDAASRNKTGVFWLPSGTKWYKVVDVPAEMSHPLSGFDVADAPEMAKMQRR